MKKISEIQILGTTYGLYVDRSGTNPKLENNDAYCEVWSKKIVFSDYRQNCMTIESLPEYVSSVIMHEIIHAFFHESGLVNYGKDELLVDWIALKLFEMSTAYQKAEKSVVHHLVKSKSSSTQGA